MGRGGRVATLVVAVMAVGMIAYFAAARRGGTKAGPAGGGPATGPATGPAGGRGMTEDQKIEALIAHVEGLKEARFVRNGTEYDCSTAGTFMRAKWRNNRDAIKTARDFIRVAATRSTTTGRPYLIRFKDAGDKESGPYLTAELERMEKGDGGGK